MYGQYATGGMSASTASGWSQNSSPQKYQAATIAVPGKPDVVEIKINPAAGVMTVDPFQHPDSKPIMDFYSKAHLISLRDSGKVNTKARSSGDLEFDTIRITLTEEESLRMSEEDKQRLQQTMTEILKRHPEGQPGERLVVSWPWHTDTKGNHHLDFMVGRFAWDLDNKWVSTGYDLASSGERAHQAQVIAAGLKQAGFPDLADFRTDRGWSIFQNKKAGPEMDEADRMAAEAGGRPVPSIHTGETVGPQRPAFDPEEQRVMSAREAEKRALAESIAAKEAIEREIAERTARIADIDHALEARTQAREARLAAEADRKAAQEALEAALAAQAEADRVKAEAEAMAADAAQKVEAADKAIFETVAERDRLLEQYGAVTAELADVQETLKVEKAAAAELADDLKEERAAADALRTQLDTTTEDLTNTRAEAAQALARESALKVDLANANEAIAKATALGEAQAKEIQDLKAQVAAIQSTLDAERQSFPERARAWAQENVVKPLQEAHAAALAAKDSTIAELRADLTAAREEIKGMMQQMRDMMQQMRESMAAGIEAQAAKVAGAVRGKQAAQEGPGADWRTVPPSQWSKEQREAAQVVYDRGRAEGKITSAQMTLEKFGEQRHNRWLKDHPQEPEGDGPKAEGPKDGPKPKR